MGTKKPSKMNTEDRDGSPQCWAKLFSGLGMCQQLGDEIQEKFLFLQNLKPLPKTVVNFGCSAKWDSFTGFEGGLEPFALLWTLKAKKVVVVDANKDSINVLRKHVSELEEKYPQCFEGRTDCFEYFVADMTSVEEMSRIPSKHFTLAYCSRVLVGIECKSGLGGIRKAIKEMARVVKPNGWVISQEAVASEPYPSYYADIFTETGFDEPKIIKQPESMCMPNLQAEYAIYKRIA
jgi:SAM-dependent methyltransferase